MTFKEKKSVQGQGCQLPGSVLTVLSSQMPRTQWVLNWPGQVTIAGCQTYWTMEVAEALEANNLSNQLFPQLAKQVGVKGVMICSPHTPRNQESPVPPGAFSCNEPVRGLGLAPKSRRSDTPDLSVSRLAPSRRDLGTKDTPGTPGV